MHYLLMMIFSHCECGVACVVRRYVYDRVSGEHAVSEGSPNLADLSCLIHVSTINPAQSLRLTPPPPASTSHRLR